MKKCVCCQQRDTVNDLLCQECLDELRIFVSTWKEKGTELHIGDRLILMKTIEISDLSKDEILFYLFLQDHWRALVMKVD